jgi:hypothetical protein
MPSVFGGGPPVPVVIYAILYTLHLTMNDFNTHAMIRALSLVNDGLISHFKDNESSAVTINRHKRDAWNSLIGRITSRKLGIGDLMAAKTNLGDMIEGRATGLDHGVTLFLVCVLFTNIPIAIACCVMNMDKSHQVEYYATTTTATTGPGLPRYIRGSLAFVPSRGSHESCQVGASGHYWGATAEKASAGWTSIIVDRILYAFGASTAAAAGSATQLVNKATSPRARSFLSKLFPAVAVGAAPVSPASIVTISEEGLQGGFPATTTTIVNKPNTVNNLSATSEKRTGIVEGSTPPNEQATATSLAAAAAAAATAAAAAAASSATADADAAAAAAPAPPPPPTPAPSAPPTLPPTLPAPVPPNPAQPPPFTPRRSTRATSARPARKGAEKPSFCQ